MTTSGVGNVFLRGQGAQVGACDRTPVGKHTIPQQSRQDIFVDMLENNWPHRGTWYYLILLLGQPICFAAVRAPIQNNNSAALL